MMFSSLAVVARTLREQGFESRHLGQEGITVWRRGTGVFFSAEELQRLTGDLAQEADAKIRSKEAYLHAAAAR